MTSLRLRLLALISVSLLVLWTLVAVWMFVDLRKEVRSALDERLAASARMVAGLMAQLPATPDLRGGRPEALVDVIGRDGLACEVSLLRGGTTLETVARTAESPGMADLAQGFGTRMFGDRMWRTYVLQQDGIRVATADRIDIRRALLRDIALTAAIPFAAALVGSLLLLWFAIGRGLAPIEGIRRQLANRRPDDDEPLVPAAIPVELRPLVRTITHLLGRVRQTIGKERRFTDAAAHELRTPLTAVKTHLQVMRLAAGQGCEEAAFESSLSQADEGVRRMQRTLEQLLLLARLDDDVRSADDRESPESPGSPGGPGGPGNPKNISSTDGDGAEPGAAVSRAVLEAEAGQVGAGRVHVVGADRLRPVAVPETLLVSAIRNLLDNALRFAPPDTEVLLEIKPVDAGRIRFSVLDRGPGLTEIECGQATERFWRRTQSPEGSGLGLSIVEAIARRHGGELRLAPRCDGGLRVDLTLPVQPGPVASRRQRAASSG